VGALRPEPPHGYFAGPYRHFAVLWMQALSHAPVAFDTPQHLLPVVHNGLQAVVVEMHPAAQTPVEEIPEQQCCPWGHIFATVQICAEAMQLPAHFPVASVPPQHFCPLGHGGAGHTALGSMHVPAHSPCASAPPQHLALLGQAGMLQVPLGAIHWPAHCPLGLTPPQQVPLLGQATLATQLRTQCV
jgi:hypothetical protein